MRHLERTFFTSWTPDPKTRTWFDERWSKTQKPEPGLTNEVSCRINELCKFNTPAPFSTISWTLDPVRRTRFLFLGQLGARALLRHRCVSLSCQILESSNHKMIKKWHVHTNIWKHSRPTPIFHDFLNPRPRSSNQVPVFRSVGCQSIALPSKSRCFSLSCQILESSNHKMIAKLHTHTNIWKHSRIKGDFFVRDVLSDFVKTCVLCGLTDCLATAFQNQGKLLWNSMDPRLD